VILAIIGVPLEVFITVSSINYFIQFYNHNGFIKKSGWLEYFLVTPSHHKVHHGTNAIYLDKNFGGTFIIWDQLFGTYQPEVQTEPVNLGIANHQRTDNIVLLNNLPILKYIGIKNTSILGKKTPNKLPQLATAVSGIIAFIILLVYIAFETVWNTHEQIIFFVIVFLVSLSSGGITEHQKWGTLLWFISGILLGVAVILKQFTSGNEILIAASLVLLLSGSYFAYSSKQTMLNPPKLP
jgi:sterol desaturase/sphingolipid hydroxylase (fatty acid hydroxylase superfamily)